MADHWRTPPSPALPVSTRGRIGIALALLALFGALLWRFATVFGLGVAGAGFLGIVISLTVIEALAIRAGRGVD